MINNIHLSPINLFTEYFGHPPLSPNMLLDPENYKNPSLIKNIIIQFPKSINQKDEEDNTPLMIAIRHGEFELAKFLLNNKADPSIFNQNHQNALHLACIQKSLELVKILVEKNVDLDARDYLSQTPVMIASGQDDHAIVSYLLSKGSDPSLVDVDDFNALHIASLYGSIASAKELIKVIDINVKNDSDDTPLMLANSKEMVVALIKNGADPTISNYCDLNALHLASQNGFIEIIEELIQVMDINVQNNLGNTPLMIASSKEAATLLLKNGADPTILDNHNANALHYACMNGQLEVAQKLVEFKGLVNKQNAYGETPLMVACMNGEFDTALVLLEWGADISLLDKEGRNAFSHALEHMQKYQQELDANKYVQFFDLMVKHGCDMFQKDNDGVVPLDDCPLDILTKWIATLPNESHHSSIEKREVGIPVSKQAGLLGKYGKGLLAWAKQNEHQEMIEILEKKLQKPNFGSSNTKNQNPNKKQKIR